MSDAPQNANTGIPDESELAYELTGFIFILAREGERAVVIGGAARVDVALERLLKSVMQHHPGGSDNLFDQDRPLGTFSAKISLAYRLGLLDAEMEKALQLIRKIRNDFAHADTMVSLSESPHANRVGELARCVKASTPGVGSRFKDARERQLLGSDLLTSFCIALSVVAVELENAAVKNAPFQATGVATLVLPKI